MAGALRMRLLRRLAEGRGRVVTKDALLFAMYADARKRPADGERVITTMVHTLRKELPEGSVTNAHGQGYRLAPAVCERFLEGNDDAHVLLARGPQDEARFRMLRQASA
jgi:DNA-binding winged helix-turn-helix (wHTH) protein